MLSDIYIYIYIYIVIKNAYLVTSWRVHVYVNITPRASAHRCGVGHSFRSQKSNLSPRRTRGRDDDSLLSRSNPLCVCVCVCIICRPTKSLHVQTYRHVRACVQHRTSPSACTRARPIKSCRVTTNRNTYNSVVVLSRPQR